MSFEACDQCGKTTPQITEIYPCKCFLAAFCSSDCLAQSTHLSECELISGPLAKLKGRSDFGSKLSDYTMELYNYANEMNFDSTKASIHSANAVTILNGISVKNQSQNADLKSLLSSWHNKNISAINYMGAGMKGDAENALNQVKAASNTVIQIFKSNNRLSLRQKGKDIENAWNSYLQSLKDAIMEIPPKGGDMNRAYDKFSSASLMAVSVGRVLGGGKSSAM
jgi:hypothetical protein